MDVWEGCCGVAVTIVDGIVVCCGGEGGVDGDGEGMTVGVIVTVIVVVRRGGKFIAVTESVDPAGIVPGKAGGGG